MDRWTQIWTDGHTYGQRDTDMGTEGHKTVRVTKESDGGKQKGAKRNTNEDVGHRYGKRSKMQRQQETSEDRRQDAPKRTREREVNTCTAIDAETRGK
ncbi:hypothetical protein WJ883_12075, partial [Coxiella burnetii]